MIPTSRYSKPDKQMVREKRYDFVPQLPPRLTFIPQLSDRALEPLNSSPSGQTSPLSDVAHHVGMPDQRYNHLCRNN